MERQSAPDPESRSLLSGGRPPYPCRQLFSLYLKENGRPETSEGPFTPEYLSQIIIGRVAGMPEMLALSSVRDGKSASAEPSVLVSAKRFAK